MGFLVSRLIQDMLSHVVACSKLNRVTAVSRLTLDIGQPLWHVILKLCILNVYQVVCLHT